MTARWFTEDGADIINNMWVATYKDGREIRQFDGGREISVDNIDRSNLLAFKIVDADGKIRFCIDLYSGDRFFYRRRTIMRAGGKNEVVTIIGRIINTGIKDVVISVFIFQDGRIELSDFNNDRFTVRGNEHKNPIVITELDNTPVM